jgi:hypothetical protein
LDKNNKIISKIDEKESKLFKISQNLDSEEIILEDENLKIEKDEISEIEEDYSQHNFLKKLQNESIPDKFKFLEEYSLKEKIFELKVIKRTFYSEYSNSNPDDDESSFFIFSYEDYKKTFIKNEKVYSGLKLNFFLKFIFLNFLKKEKIIKGISGKKDKLFYL